MSKYFTGLNYSLANEDSWVEYHLARDYSQLVFSISGSGSRVIPLLARNPQRLVIGDLSQDQLYLAELRIEAIRTLSYPEFLYFLGYRGALSTPAGTEDSRTELFEKLKISPSCRDFWEKNRSIWEPHGFVYLGRWERHFIRMGRALKKIGRLDATPLFTAQSLAQQRTLYQRHWKERVFRLFLKMALSDFIFNRYLYRGAYAGSRERRTVQESAGEFVFRELTQRFNHTLLRKNYFLQMVFLGCILYEEGLPPEAQPEIFQAAKAAQTEIVYRQGDFLEIIQSEPFTFYSLSDTISYVSDQQARTLLTGIPAASTEIGSRMVIRSFMRQPRIDLPEGWHRDEELQKKSRSDDCTGLYDFVILDRS